MALPPIQISLSKFEQIEILRTEIERREEELRQVEKQIRDALFEVERQRYLQSLHPLFQKLPAPELAAQVPQLNANREALSEAIAAMQAALGVLETETAGQTAPRAANAAQSAASRRPKFDSFEQFRMNKTGGG